jgi:protein RecA
MQNNERRKQLILTMKLFNKKQDGDVLSFGNESEDKEVISTGIKTFDNFIGGGTKRGTFTVIYGGQSVGKSTLVLQAIANAQKSDKICCYIDLEHTFDKERAISLGIDLDLLILAEKCQNAEQALEIIRTLCNEKVVDLIVVDSIQAMSPKNEQENKGKERELASKEIAELARTLSKFFRVVAPGVFNAQASVIMIGQIRIAGIGSFYTHADMSGGEALKHWASTRCFIRRGQGGDAPVEKFKEYFIDPDGKVKYATQKEKIGFDTVIKLEKTKSCSSEHEGSEIHLPFVFNKGFVDSVVEDENIPIRIDAKNEEEKEIISQYLMKKDIVINKEIEKSSILEEQSVEITTEIKKKRGRPSKK